MSIRENRADSQNDQPAISSEVLARLYLMEASAGKGFVDELIDLFLEDTPKRIARLEDVAGRGSAQAIGAAAHALKNNAGHFGADNMRKLCFEIEEQALNGRSEIPPSMLSELKLECDRVQRALLAEKTKR